MCDIEKAYFKSPIGNIEISGSNEGITRVDFIDSQEVSSVVPDILFECVKQLNEYFKGTRKEFTLKLFLDGTKFQKQVWRKLIDIPYGETVSYGALALSVFNPKAVRAVGGANHNNKISIIIPCHRVIAKNGKLTGYAGGLWRKEWLLEHEKQYK
jgi:methylated-DNA-[protein]-cysteine S-methyltransferase